jgi:hypothetical protein
MNQPPRFVIGRGHSHFLLDNNRPWNRSTRARRAPALRIGWRCVSYIPPGLEAKAEECLRSYDGGRDWSALGHRVNVSVIEKRLPIPRTDATDMFLVVDLWAERPRSTSSDVRQVTEALDVVRKQVAAWLNLFAEDEQEYLHIRLPRFVSRHLSSGRAKAAISEGLSRERAREGFLSSLDIAGSCLDLGP